LLRRAAVSAAALPLWMPRLAFAGDAAPQGDTLVCVFLRGAADVLNMVVPHGEAAYYRERPTLAIPRPDDGAARPDLRAHDLDGFFGLHPSLAPLLTAWQAGHLAIVHACGTPDESRSHFEAMAIMERGASDRSGPASGWIGRHLAQIGRRSGSPLRAVGFGERLPHSLYGPIPATALRSIADFHLGGRLPDVAPFQSALTALYGDDPQLEAAALGTLSVIDTLARLDPLRYQTPGVSYPESELGQALKQTALLVKAEVGLEVACIDVDGWDTHFAQGGSQGLMAGLLTDLAAGLAAFHADVRDQLGRISVVVMSEFGRRVRENGSLGTDHGHGSAMLLLGGGIRGGRVYGRWPGLEGEWLVGPGDLAITTDYRDVLGELVGRRLGNPQLDTIFPGHTVRALGVTRSSEAPQSGQRMSS
jgi:uncharacterized protein (DUF1501 family)